MEWLKTLEETLFSVGMFVNAALFFPQALTLLKSKDSREISLTTFLGFWIIQILAVIHGYLHQDIILMIGFGLSLITCGWVVYLCLLYRVRNK